jgi:hypothetical protein
MNIVIDQPGGLGDIFFIQKIATVLSKSILFIIQSLLLVGPLV